MYCSCCTTTLHLDPARWIEIVQNVLEMGTMMYGILRGHHNQSRSGAHVSILNEWSFGGFKKYLVIWFRIQNVEDEVLFFFPGFNLPICENRFTFKEQSGQHSKLATLNDLAAPFTSDAQAWYLNDFQSTVHNFLLLNCAGIYFCHLICEVRRAGSAELKPSNEPRISAHAAHAHCIHASS